MDTSIRAKLERILALTTSPNENEAAVAMEKLHQLLTQHNLSIADLETRGQNKPGVESKEFDLGKAAFKWKLDLADVIAEHYYCHPLVDRTNKTVRFIGRPDNVDSLTALYRWIIEQIKDISRRERVEYQKGTGEHIDPLRWQVNFGIGAVNRLEVRLRDLKSRQSEDNQVHALVIHHQSEISDWLEDNGYRRTDGKESKQQREWREERERKAQFKAECEANGDMEAFYQKYPWDRPLTEEEREAQKKRNAEWEKEWAKKQAASERSRRAAATRRERSGWNEEQYRKSNQVWSAMDAGERAADSVNLTPFVTAGKKVGELV